MGAWKLASLLVLVVVVGQVTGWEVADQVAIAILVLLTGAWLWSRLSLRDLSLTRRLATDRAQVGDVLRERFEVRNRGRLAKLWVEVADHSSLPRLTMGRVLHLRGRSVATWETQTPCVRRGRFRIGPMSLRAGDPIGLFPRRLTIPEAHDLVVYPALFDLHGMALPTGLLAGGRAVERRGAFATPNVSGIREYAPSDGLNRISWTATARLGRMMVKEFDVDPSADAWIVLDHDAAFRVASGHGPVGTAPGSPLSYLDSTEEYGVSLAASLARHLLGLGRTVGLIVSGARLEIVPADRTDRQLLKMLDLLAVAQADGMRPLAETLTAESRRFTRNDSVWVLTASTDERWVDALVELATRRVRATAVVIEPATFGPAPSSLFVVSRLAAAGLPTHMVKFGDDLAAVLAPAASRGGEGARHV